MAKPIFLAGDTWGVGTLNIKGRMGFGKYRTKIETYFLGYDLINVSSSASSNLVSYNLIEENISFDYDFVWIHVPPLRDIFDSINNQVIENNKNNLNLYTQKIKIEEDFFINLIQWLSDIDDIEKLLSKTLVNTYTKFNDLAKKNNKLIHCIGGCQKILPEVNSKYTNLRIVIPSIVELFYPELNLDNFTFSDFVLSTDKLEKLKNHKTININYKNNLSWLIEQHDKTLEIFQRFNDQKQKGYFYPNMFHPNEAGVKIWTEHLKQMLD